jgi:membrane protein YqaA with SNARE-associated domain
VRFAGAPFVTNAEDEPASTEERDVRDGASERSSVVDAPGWLGLTRDQRRVLRQIVTGFLVLFGGAFFVAWRFEEQTLEAGRWFVESFGGFGIFLGYYLTDALFVPFPNDTFTILGWLGGMSILQCTLWGSAGSVAGGFTGYAIGYHLLRRSRRAKVLLGSGEGSMLRRVRRGGVVFLALTAVTPLPFASGCWVAGMIEMPLLQFGATCLLRIIKVSGYLWLFTRGLVTL